MRFPDGWPDFTDDQTRDLKAYGVCDEQITELRFALIGVRQYTRTPPPKSEIAEHLADIERLASELSRKISAAVVPDAARLIEEGYWQQRLTNDGATDDGATVAGHLCPRLNTLAAVASAAIEAMPKGPPVRSKVGNPAPVKRIADALMTGWVKSSGWISGGKPLPSSHRPSVSTGPKGHGRAFPDIVKICYAAVGYDRIPKNAIERFVKAYYRERKEILAGFDKALSELE